MDILEKGKEGRKRGGKEGGRKGERKKAGEGSREGRRGSLLQGKWFSCILISPIHVSINISSLWKNAQETR